MSDPITNPRDLHFERQFNSTVGRDGLRTRSIRAGIFTGAASFCDLAIRLISTAILARLILPEHFGLVMMVMAVVAIAEQFRDLGLSTATVQRTTITHSEVSNLFWLNLAISVGLAVIVCALSPLIAAYFKEPRLVAITCALAINFPFSGAMAQHQALLTRQLRLGHTSAMRLAANVISTGLAVFLAWKGADHWALVARELSRNMLLAIGMWAVCRWIPSLPSLRTDVRGMISFGVHLTGANILGTIGAAADRLLLGRYLGAAPVGVYRQGYQLITSITDQVVSPLYQVSQPALCRVQSQPELYRAYFRRVLMFVCILTMPLSAFVIMFSGEITRVLLGPKWGAAAPVLAILAVGTMIKQPIGAATQILISMGKGRTHLQLSGGFNVLLIIFLLIGVQWGTKGVAAAEVAAIYVMAIPRVAAGCRGSPFSVADFCDTLLLPILATIVSLGAGFLTRSAFVGHSDSVFLIIGSLTTCLGFFGTYLLIPRGRHELIGTMVHVMRAFRRSRDDSANNMSGPAIESEPATPVSR